MKVIPITTLAYKPKRAFCGTKAIESTDAPECPE